MNALSRVIEESLLRHSIPYQVARGTAFYQRKEIKDALAYLRVIANPDDEVSLDRIINTPTRGIGDTTVEHLKAYAVANGVSLWQAVERGPADSALAGRATAAVSRFARMVETWRQKVDGADEQALGFVPGVRDVVEMVLRDSGLEALYKDGKSADEEKLNNLHELVSAAQRFDEQYEGESGTDTPPVDGRDAHSTAANDLRQRLHDYLESVALVSDVDAVEGGGGAVTLMTLHAAKGLEFQVVAMIGLEDGVLPHSRSRDSAPEMEEERRLCFVGITRAQQHLLLTHAKYRTIRGLRERTIPSPFLKELGEKGLVREDRAVFGDSGWDRYDEGDGDGHAQAEAALRIGARVEHPKFGRGKVMSLSPARRPERAKVYFDRFGAKTLVLEYARLEILD
jgi:DNA helicase II / ATP-dependent DNA helicase PcrA